MLLSASIPFFLTVTRIRKFGDALVSMMHKEDVEISIMIRNSSTD